MTCSQTIAIDTEGAFNPEFPLNVSTVTEPHKLNSHNSMPCETFSTIKKDVMLSEFNDFLASLSQRNAQNVAASFPKKDDHFILEDTNNPKIDKENVLPTCLTKLALPERDHMDMTSSHTVIIEGGAFQHFPYSIYGKELTHSQTATINFKGMENKNHSISHVDQKKYKFVCDDTSEMIMTEVLDECIQDQEQLSEQNRTSHIQSNVCFVPVTDADMEVTQSQTVVLETKYGGEPFSSNSDRKMMNTTQRGNITPGALGPCETGECKSNMTLAAHTVIYNDQSDSMDLTCQGPTGVLSPNLDDPLLTGCSNVAVDSKHISTANVMSKPQASFMLPPSVSPEIKRTDHFKNELSLFHIVDDMEITQFHTVNDDLEKASHTVGDDMEMTECQAVSDDLEKSCHTVCCDMEMTQCQTVVLETKNCDCKPSDKSRKRLSLVSASFRNKGVTREHAGHMELNKYSFSCVVPTAQKFLLQDLSDCMEKQQGTAFDMPLVHDDMELTGCKTFAIDTKASWVTSPSNKVQTALCGLSSIPTMDKLKRSESFSEKLGTGPVSRVVDCRSPISEMDLDAGNHVDKHKETVADVAGMNLARDQIFVTRAAHKLWKPSNSDNVNEHVSLNSSVKYVDSSKEDCNMEITRAFTVPLEEQCCVAFNEEDMAREAMETILTTNQKVFKEMDYTLSINNKNVSSSQKAYVFESDDDTLKKEHLSPVESRRRSLADLQVKLQNISQYIGKPDGLLAGSVTAPIVSFTVMSPVEKHCERDHSSQPSKETELLENKISSPNKVATVPFNLKHSLMARLSVGGIMPKFPPRARSASPSQTEPGSPDGLQGMQLQTCFNADLQNSCCETDLIDEVFPEEDLSGTLVSCLSKNKEQEVTGVQLNEDGTEYDHMESVMNISDSTKMPPEVKDPTMKDSSKKLVRFVLY